MKDEEFREYLRTITPPEVPMHLEKILIGVYYTISNLTTEFEIFDIVSDATSIINDFYRVAMENSVRNHNGASNYYETRQAFNQRQIQLYQLTTAAVSRIRDLHNLQFQNLIPEKELSEATKLPETVGEDEIHKSITAIFDDKI